MAGRPFTVDQAPGPAGAGGRTVVTGWAGPTDDDPVQCYPMPGTGAPFVLGSVDELTVLLDDLMDTTEVRHSLTWRE